MSFQLFKNGCWVISVSYLRRKPDGSFFYQRRIPQDLKSHYPGKTHMPRTSLGRDAAKAARAAAKLASEHDALWATLRSPQGQDLGLTTPQARKAGKALLNSWDLKPGDRLNANGTIRKTFDNDIILDHFGTRYGSEYLEAYHDDRSPVDPASFHNAAEREALRLLNELPGEPQRLLSDALDDYLRDHSKGLELKFRQDTARAIQQVYNVVGDLPLGSYTRANAKAVRDALNKGVRSGTVRRRLDTINAVFSHGIRELDVRGVTNPFKELPIVKDGLDATERQPFSIPELKTISQACLHKNDDIRWIIGLQIDTGARLSEIVGLRVTCSWKQPFPTFEYGSTKPWGAPSRPPAATGRCTLGWDVSLGR